MLQIDRLWDRSSEDKVTWIQRVCKEYKNSKGSHWALTEANRRERTSELNWSLKTSGYLVSTWDSSRDRPVFTLQDFTLGSCRVCSLRNPIVKEKVKLIKKDWDYDGTQESLRRLDTEISTREWDGWPRVTYVSGKLTSEGWASCLCSLQVGHVRSCSNGQ